MNPGEAGCAGGRVCNVPCKAGYEWVDGDCVGVVNCAVVPHCNECGPCAGGAGCYSGVMCRHCENDGVRGWFLDQRTRTCVYKT